MWAIEIIGSLNTNHSWLNIVATGQIAHIKATHDCYRCHVWACPGDRASRQQPSSLYRHLWSIFLQWSKNTSEHNPAFNKRACTSPCPIGNIEAEETVSLVLVVKLLYQIFPFCSTTVKNWWKTLWPAKLQCGCNACGLYAGPVLLAQINTEFLYVYMSAACVMCKVSMLGACVKCWWSMMIDSIM